MKKFIGIDIGGTEIKGGVVTERGEIVHFAKQPTDAQKGPVGICASLDRVISELCKNEKNVGEIGIASAGNIDADAGKVLYATDNLPGYTGLDIRGHVKKEFGMDCRCENDAYAALIGEMKFGAARGYRNVAMITIGTGIGGAAAIDGKIVHGSSFAAARWGHVILIAGGKLCNCGQSGCSEAYLSGTAFTNGARELGYRISHGSEVFDLIGAGDVILQQYLSYYLQNLVSLISTVKNAVDPQAIILGGGFVRSKEYWWNQLLQMTNEVGILLPAQLENTAGILGAASLLM